MKRNAGHPLAEIIKSHQAEIGKYKWLESEKVGRDIGWERAAHEWTHPTFFEVEAARLESRRSGRVARGRKGCIIYLIIRSVSAVNDGIPPWAEVRFWGPVNPQSYGCGKGWTAHPDGSTQHADF